MFFLDQLKNDKTLWINDEHISVYCSWCNNAFSVKNGTLYSIIRRNSEAIFCSQKCNGSFRAKLTQEKYNLDGGKTCKRCQEFLPLDNFSTLPNPPYFRAECKICHNNKPARHIAIYKERAKENNIPFELKPDDFASKKNCNYCGGLVRNLRIELINESMGYLKNNCIICCNDCYKFKNNLDHDTFINMCLKIANNIGVNNV